MKKTEYLKNPSAVARQQLVKQKYNAFATSNFNNHSGLKQSKRKYVLPTPAAFYNDAIEAISQRDSDWAWGRCPFHADSNPSFCMNLESGFYKCMSSNCGETGGNIVSFVSALHGLTRKEAVRYLEGCV